MLVTFLLLQLHFAPMSARPGLGADTEKIIIDGLEDDDAVTSAAPTGKAAAAAAAATAGSGAPATLLAAAFVPLAKTWVSSSGHRFSLDDAFEAVFEADYDGGKVAVSLGGKVRCGMLFNPRSVAACSYDAAADGNPKLIALKRSGLIGLAIAARPELGTRVILQNADEDDEAGALSTAATATIDFVCDPGMRRAKGEWTVVGTRKPGEQYFVSVKSAYGCPIRIVPVVSPGGGGGSAGNQSGGAGAFDPESAAVKAERQKKHPRRPRRQPTKPVVDLPKGIIEWVGTQGFGWRFELKRLAKAVIEFEAPHDVGFLEASIADAVYCGDSEDPSNVLSCLYPDGQEPIVVGLKSAMSVWRASERGIELKFNQKGSCSGVGTDRATWIRLVCDRSIQEWIAEPVYPYKQEDCLFIIEVRSTLACPTLLGQKPPDKSAVIFQKKKKSSTSGKEAAKPADGPSAGKSSGGGGGGGDTAQGRAGGGGEQGCIKGDCQNGVGTFRWPSGTAYSGDWANGQRDGKGNQLWSDGRKYSGDWKSGDRHGQGAHTYARGDRYEGQWIQDHKDGEGTYFWADGSFYNGFFKNDVPSGYGTKHWPSHNTHYVGAWAHGQQNGYGTLTYAGGNTWTGEWKDGQKTADGKMQCTKTQFKFKDHCFQECPLGTFPSLRHCLVCPKGCGRCSSTSHGSDRSCTACLPDFTLKQSRGHRTCEKTVQKTVVVHDDL